jgi:hypothetical protein
MPVQIAMYSKVKPVCILMGFILIASNGGNCEGSAPLPAAEEADGAREEEPNSFQNPFYGDGFPFGLRRSNRNSLDKLSPRTGRLCREHQDFLQKDGMMGFRLSFKEEEDPIAKNCSDASETARGEYFASSDCTFTFHKIEEDEQWSDQVLTTACSDANILHETLKDGTSRNSTFQMQPSPFPDQCVKNFRRCYSIDHDWKSFLAVFCQNFRAIPNEATHLSVDCTKDFYQELQTNRSIRADPFAGARVEYQGEQHKKDLEVIDVVATRAEKIVFGLSVLVLVSCFVCAGAFYLLVVRPYQQSQLLDSGLRRRRTGGPGGATRLPFLMRMPLVSTTRSRPKAAVSALPTTKKNLLKP